MVWGLIFIVGFGMFIVFFVTKLVEISRSTDFPTKRFRGKKRCDDCGQIIQPGEEYAEDFFPELSAAGLHPYDWHHRKCLEEQMQKGNADGYKNIGGIRIGGDSNYWLTEQAKK